MKECVSQRMNTRAIRFTSSFFALYDVASHVSLAYDVFTYFFLFFVCVCFLHTVSRMNKHIIFLQYD